MVLHPAIHLEIARQRHNDLLAEAERQRIVRAVHLARATQTTGRQPRRASASRPAFKPEVAGHSDVEVGLEV
jgi:hypothetical protein